MGGNDAAGPPPAADTGAGPGTNPALGAPPAAIGSLGGVGGTGGINGAAGAPPATQSSAKATRQISRRRQRRRRRQTAGRGEIRQTTRWNAASATETAGQPTTTQPSGLAHRLHRPESPEEAGRTAGFPRAPCLRGRDVAEPLAG